ncbi:MAG: class I SAM-dependent methyltransferase, partial [Actinoplanes sp.]
LAGVDVLCLASGGGQQGPTLAAAGARVTVLDNSPRQLEQDELVARRDDVPLRTMLGDMRGLSAFADSSFDLVVTGFEEAPHHSDAIAGWLPGYFATRAVKP